MPPPGASQSPVTAAACLRTNEAAGRTLGGAYGKAALLGKIYTTLLRPAQCDSPPLS